MTKQVDPRNAEAKAMVEAVAAHHQNDMDALERMRERGEPDTGIRGSVDEEAEHQQDVQRKLDAERAQHDRQWGPGLLRRAMPYQPLPPPQFLGTPKLNEALAAAAAEYGTIKRTREGQDGNRKFKYADLADVYEAVRGPLSKNGLVLSHRLEDSALVATLRHVSGEELSSRIPVGDPVDWKDYGKAITYATRYAVSGLLGVAPEDDADAPSAPRSRAGDGGGLRGRDAQPQPPRGRGRSGTFVWDHEAHRERIEKGFAELGIPEGAKRDALFAKFYGSTSLLKWLGAEVRKAKAGKDAQPAAEERSPDPNLPTAEDITF